MNSILPYILNLFQEYGYPILWLSVFVGAVGIPLPNSLLLLAAGAFAALGDFNFAILIIMTITAFVAGDNCSYWLGRFWGSKVLDWLEKSGKVRLVKPQTIARSRVYFNRRGGWAIFFSRFLVSGLGGAINILAGAELYPYRKFMLYDLCGEALGALIPLSLGYIFGASWDAIGDILGSFSLFILIFLVALFLSYQTIKIFKRIRKLEQLRRNQVYEQPLEVPAASPRLSGSDGRSSPSNNLPL